MKIYDIAGYAIILAYALACMALNILVGHTGLVSFGHGAWFGLAAYAFTSSTKTATAVADAIESGMVGVNSIAISTPETPFGGVKDSGYGSEGGPEALEAYLNTKTVAMTSV